MLGISSCNWLLSVWFRKALLKVAYKTTDIWNILCCMKDIFHCRNKGKYKLQYGMWQMYKSEKVLKVTGEAHMLHFNPFLYHCTNWPQMICLFSIMHNSCICHEMTLQCKIAVCLFWACLFFFNSCIACSTRLGSMSVNK